MDFAVKYIGHIDERKRPENFPKVVSTVGTYQAENYRLLADIIQQEFEQIVRLQGMIVHIAPTIIETNAINVKNRIFIPMHMITHLETEINNMAAMPRIVETESGKELQNADGSKVIPS